jgi:hypothetical protein
MINKTMNHIEPEIYLNSQNTLKNINTLKTIY